MQTVNFPLNELQISLLKLTENLKEEEIRELKKLIISFKAHRLAMMADKVWDTKKWTQETMDQFLNTHMRTPYVDAPSNNNKA